MERLLVSVAKSASITRPTDCSVSIELFDKLSICQVLAMKLLVSVIRFLFKTLKFRVTSKNVICMILIIIIL